MVDTVTGRMAGRQRDTGYQRQNFSVITNARTSTSEEMSGRIRRYTITMAFRTACFVAMISISIGLLNLFPVPLLDGGHLLFYSIEALRGKPLSERAQEVGFRIGLAIVVMLMVFATYNDILHLWTRWFAS